jgi:hypothetical protein
MDEDEAAEPVAAEHDVADSGDDSMEHEHNVESLGEGETATAADVEPPPAPVKPSVHDRISYAATTRPDLYPSSAPKFASPHDLVAAFKDGVVQYLTAVDAPEHVVQLVSQSFAALAKACVLSANGLYRYASAIDSAAENVDYPDEWYIAQQELSLMADRIQVALVSSAKVTGVAKDSIIAAVLDDRFMGCHMPSQLERYRLSATGCERRAFDLTWGGVCDACGIIAHQPLHKCTPASVPVGYRPQHCFATSTSDLRCYHASQLKNARAAHTAVQQQQQLVHVAKPIDPSMIMQLQGKPDVLNSVIAKQQQAAALLAQAQQEAAMALSAMQAATTPQQQPSPPPGSPPAQQQPTPVPFQHVTQVPANQPPPPPPPPPPAQFPMQRPPAAVPFQHVMRVPANQPPPPPGRSPMQEQRIQACLDKLTR